MPAVRLFLTDLSRCAARRNICFINVWGKTLGRQSSCDTNKAKVNVVTRNETTYTRLYNVWQKQTVENEKLFLLIAKRNLKGLAYQKIDSYIDNSNKCLIYKYIPKQRLLQQYLVKNISPKCRNIITKFRISAHKLGIETGRFNAVPREDRTCSKCNLNDLENHVTCFKHMNEEVKLSNV